MTYAQYIQKFIGNSAWLSQNPHGWFEFTLAIRANTGHVAVRKGRMFEAEHTHTITDIHDDFVVVTNRPISTYTRLIPLSLFVLPYIEQG